MKKITLLSLLLLTACGTPSISPGASQVQADQPPKQIQAESVSSRTVRTLTYKILRRYDHNLNKAIDYRETNTFWKSLIGKNESERRRSSYSSARREVEFVVWNYSVLFLAADKDNDGVATGEEIESYITQAYDKDGDGILKTRGWWRFWRDPEEWEFFKREMKEDVRRHRIPFGFKPPANGGAEARAAEQSPQNTPEVTPLFLSEKDLQAQAR